MVNIWDKQSPLQITNAPLPLADHIEISEDESEDGSESNPNPLVMTLYHQPSAQAASEKVPTLLIDLGTLLSNVIGSGSVSSALKVVSSEVASTSSPSSLVMDTLNELKKENEAICYTPKFALPYSSRNCQAKLQNSPRVVQCNSLPYSQN